MFSVSSDMNSGKKVKSFSFSGGGVFWVSSDLNSGKKVRVFHFQGEGGVLGKVGLGLWEQLQIWGGGGGFWDQFPEQGCSREFGQKFLEA